MIIAAWLLLNFDTLKSGNVVTYILTQDILLQMVLWVRASAVTTMFRKTNYFQLCSSGCDRNQTDVMDEKNVKIAERKRHYSPPILMRISFCTWSMHVRRTNGCIITVVGLGCARFNNSPDSDPYSCCRSDRKVDELHDSVRFRTDAGVKVGHGNRGVNEQTDFFFSVEASSISCRNRNCFAQFVQQSVIRHKHEDAGRLYSYTLLLHWAAKYL